MNEFLWFLWHLIFDPVAVIKDDEGNVVEVEKFTRRDYYQIFQPDWWRFRFADQQLPCGCQFRKTGGQILFCMNHSGFSWEEK